MCHCKCDLSKTGRSSQSFLLCVEYHGSCSVTTDSAGFLQWQLFSIIFLCNPFVVPMIIYYVHSRIISMVRHQKLHDISNEVDT